LYFWYENLPSGNPGLRPHFRKARDETGVRVEPGPDKSQLKHTLAVQIVQGSILQSSISAENFSEKN
jgi:hypothetical protein